MATVRFLQHAFGPGPHGLFLGLTFLGASVVLWTLLILFHWLVDPGFARRLGVFFAASIITNHIFKGLFGTDRPYDVDPTLSTGLARRTGGGHGFPSGHSQNAATFWLAFAFHYRRAWLWIAAVLTVLLVGTSRLYLGVHMPIDVLGGFTFGAVFAWAAGRGSSLAPIRVSRNAWVPAVGIACLALGFLSEADPRVCGLLAGCLIARTEGFTPPRTAGGRIGIAAGGLLLLAVIGALLIWLPDRLVPGMADSTALAYLAFLVLALTGFELWPRIWQAASMRS